MAAAAGVVAAAVFVIAPLARGRRRAGQSPVTGITAEISGGQGVQIGPNNVQVNQYIQAYITGQSPLASSAPDSVVVGDVPRRAPAFQPRADLLARLGESGPGVTVVRAMTGIRGVGKTQIAAAYARSCIDAGWRLVAWVNAEDSAEVLNGLAGVAEALGVGGPRSDLQSIGGSVRRRLEAAGDRCLVVFDNADDVDAVARFLPSAGRCQVIITSNRLEAGALGAVIAVDVFTEDEALRFLEQRTGRRERDSARELAAELGFLPLALAHAAAVIAAQHLDYRTFLARLRAAPVRDLLKRSAGEPYPRGAAEAILLALDAAEQQDQRGLSRGLLNMIALLSAAGVSRALLYAAGQQGLLNLPGAEAAVGPEAIDEALGRLAGSSLLTFSVDDATVSMHRLTRRVAVEDQAHDGGVASLGTGVAALLVTVTESLGEPWHNRPPARDAIQQIMALQAHLAPHLGGGNAALVDTMIYLRAWAVWCLNHLGDSSAQAIEYGRELVADSERVLGGTHADTLAFRNNLAGAYRAAGRLDEAVALLERNLADRRQVLGETHPSVLTSRNNLAGAYQAEGRLDEAVELFERSLADSQRVLGGAHPETLSFRNNLAGAYRSAGRLDEAIGLFESTLADAERVMGESNPWALSFRSNLAGAYGAAGRLDEAIGLFESTLADSERVLGGTDPDVLGSRNNLALAYQAAGRLDEAIGLFERTLADRERVLGEAHPDSLASRDDLVRAYEAAGRLDETERLRNRSVPGAARDDPN